MSLYPGAQPPGAAAEEIVIREHLDASGNRSAVEVVNAPASTSISLALLHQAVEPWVKIEGNHITLGYPESVHYVVVGWDPETAGLVVVKED